METILEGTPVLSRDNRFPYTITLQRRDTADELVAADGLTVIAFLAESEGGTAITNTQKTLTEKSGALGTYANELEGGYVNTVIDIGRSGYWICYRIVSETLDIWVPVTVQKRRRAAAA